MGPTNLTGTDYLTEIRNGWTQHTFNGSLQAAVDNFEGYNDSPEDYLEDLNIEDLPNSSAMYEVLETDSSGTFAERLSRMSKRILGDISEFEGDQDFIYAYGEHIIECYTRDPSELMRYFRDNEHDEKTKYVLGAVIAAGENLAMWYNANTDRTLTNSPNNTKAYTTVRRSSKSSLPCTIGVELTYHTYEIKVKQKKIQINVTDDGTYETTVTASDVTEVVQCSSPFLFGDKSKSPCHSIVDDINNLKNFLNNSKLENKHRIYVDSGDMVEIASSPFGTGLELLAFYRKFNKLMKGKYRCIPVHPTKCGGGMHINMGFDPDWTPQFTENFARNMIFDLGQRPYLGWIFNDPEDDKTSNCPPISSTYQYDRLLSNKPKRQLTAFQKDMGIQSPSADSRNFGDKSCSINCHNTYAELRFFGMVENEREFCAAIKFATAYYRMIEKKTGDNQHIKPLSYSVRKKTLWRDNALSMFRILLDELGLDYNDYKNFVHRNFWTRVHFGGAYLT